MKTSPDAQDCQAAAAEATAGGTDRATLEEPPRSEPPPAAVSVEMLGRDLREAQAEVRRLRAFLSHGLRQPMAALTIWAELLNAKQSAALDEQGRRYLRELTASVHRIAAMLSSEMQATSTLSAEPRPSDEPPPPAAPRGAQRDSS